MKKLLLSLALLLLPSLALAEETISLGLTLKIPSQGERNWGTEFRESFAKPLSSHRHTGAGDGNQLISNSYGDNSVTGPKIRLANGEWLRSRNFANTADLNLLRLNSSDQAEFATALTLNLATPLAVTSGGTGAATAAGARSNLELGALAVVGSPLAVSNGGTGGTTVSTARNNLSAAASGANTDITSLTPSPAVLAVNGSWTFGSDGNLYPTSTARSIGTTGNRISNLFLSGAITATNPEAVRTGLGIGGRWAVNKIGPQTTNSVTRVAKGTVSLASVETNDMLVCFAQVSVSSDLNGALFPPAGVLLFQLDVNTDGTDEQFVNWQTFTADNLGYSATLPILGMKDGVSGTVTCTLYWVTTGATAYSNQTVMHLIALRKR